MKTMALFAVMTILFAVTVAHAQEQGGPAELDALKGKYEEAQAAMDAECEQKKAQALDSYTNALSAYRAQLKQSGQLKAYLDIDKELVRLSDEKTFCPPAVTSPYVTKAAEKYDQSVTKATAEHQRKTVLLLGQYLDRLRDLIKTLMKKDRMADAGEVQLEIDRLEFIWADNQVKKAEPVTKPVVVEKPAPARVSPTLSKGLRVAGKYVATTNITINSQSSRGTAIGSMAKGDTISLKYVSGVWYNAGRTSNPDGGGEMGIQIAAESGSGLAMVCRVPPQTKLNPFTYRFEKDCDGVTVRISDVGWVSDNSGASVWELETRKKDAPSTAPKDTPVLGAQWERRVVQGNSRNHVYLVHNGVRYYVDNFNYVAPLGLSGGNLIRVNQAEIDALPEGERIDSVDDAKRCLAK